MSDTPKIFQPSNMASRKRDREAAGRPARRAPRIDRIDTSEPIIIPARVPVAQRSNPPTLNDQEDQ